MITAERVAELHQLADRATALVAEISRVVTPGTTRDEARSALLTDSESVASTLRDLAQAVERNRDLDGRLTNTQTDLLRRAGIMAERAKRHPNAFPASQRGAMVYGSGELSAARALARRGKVRIFSGLGGWRVALIDDEAPCSCGQTGDHTCGAAR